MTHLQGMLSSFLGDRLIAGEAGRAPYAQSEGHHVGALPALVAQPVSIDEVCRVVQAAAAEGVAVIGYGAGTSLEGNAAAVTLDTLVVDFSRMNDIVEIAPEDLIAVVQPGVSREQLNEQLRTTGLFFPVDPGANATIGGMIATRASGTTTVRYGNMRDNLLALKVVTASGALIQTGTRARKSAAGYDLTHLFAGSEGTLGLIVEATLRLHGQPEQIVSASWDFESVEGAVDTVIQTIQSGVAVARMELLDTRAMIACNRQSHLGLPECPTLFLEFHGSAAGIAEQLDIVRMLGDTNGGGTLKTATATEERNALWKARHHLLWASRAMVPGAQAWITDICVPISRLAEAISRAETMIEASGLFAPILGHVGDGNFHVFFILQPDDAPSWSKAAAINEAMIDHALSVGGTCTGEHGIGLGKQDALRREIGAPAVDIMRNLKQALDPQGILNPGKIFI
ncbi:FAD-binding oxidoreductase [Sphingopyxis sp.]|uniref:FAD-binding oxidoreductase n=1 Tax=Sphingopyxis sp. TaxID=1908224 RepID=UPI003D80C6CA